MFHVAQPKTCSKCRSAEAQNGQRWCRTCRTTYWRNRRRSAAETIKALRSALLEARTAVNAPFGS